MQDKLVKSFLYPKRTESRSHAFNFYYSYPEEIVHIHDLFTILSVFLCSQYEEKQVSLRLLLSTGFSLYGWEDTPLVAALQNVNTTIEEIKKSRTERWDEFGNRESLSAIDIYWTYYDALIRIPLSWFRPFIGGDVFCNRLLRYPFIGKKRSNVALLPSLEEKPYQKLRVDMAQIGRDAIERCQDIERSFVEFYGSVKREIITVQDILDFAPEVQEFYFLDPKSL